MTVSAPSGSTTFAGVHRDGVALVAHGLTKKFAGHTAVDNLSFTAPPGVVTGFLGPNGAGKTTTLRMMLGLVTPTSGNSSIGGVAFDQLQRPALAVGAVLDSLSLHAQRSALNHLKIYATAIGKPMWRVDEVLEIVGLTSVADRKAGEYSLGMRQRLALATALIGDPPVLVLDEPANGLDPEGIAWLRQFLQAFAGRGGTVLVSSHLLREVEQTVDHLVIISRGQLVYEGSVDSLRNSRKDSSLVACSDPNALVSGLIERGLYDSTRVADGRVQVFDGTPAQIEAVASTIGVEIFGMVSDAADLEQVFLSMTAGQYTGNLLGHPGSFPGGAH